MAVIKYLWFLVLFALKEACADLKCEIQDDDGEILKCTNDEVYNLVLQRGFLSSYRNATTIIMNLCSIVNIDTEVFEDVPSLKTLDLSVNYIENITIGTFDGLTELEELNLFNNYIEDLPVDIFKFNVNLKKLNIGDNVLFWLNVGVFDSLVNLTSLVLSSNYIAGNYWDPEVFRRNVNIMNIQFNGNNMSEAPQNLLSRFDKLISVNLKNCHLTEFPAFLISSNKTNVIILNLRENEIRIIEKDFFENYEIISILDLSRNQIEYIAEYSFKSMKKLTFLNLSRNLLTTLPHGLFATTYRLSLLDLSHNMLTVLQEDLFKRTKLKNLNVAYNRLTYLQQDFCQQQKNTGAILKIFFFNHNPWQCACLKELLNEVKRSRINYNFTYFDGVQPVCVTEEFVCKRQENVNSFYADLFDSTVKNVM
ncbi:PREDICTED: carboxypeptidase N subunit 2-like [Papilio polytes]|uniref:carboxypeptidase N subunit 2-like n=1 Tax=Papilio polytes TaxID=76194 RepID=UPI000675C21E|nr:PREDICTED: carboxypeptidase N subunit 2-like [Papilio polytes]